MRILIVHNYYQKTGGEDVVVAAECELLTSHGHDVHLFTESNSNVSKLGWYAAINTVWSHVSYRALKKKLAQFQPNIVHVHNTLMMLSPSMYYACAEARVPVVQTLHNYRLMCVNGLFYKDNRVCEKCLYARLPLDSVKYACYRNSRLQTSAVASMLIFHRWMGTWEKKIDHYIALTDFARQKFIAGGLPPQKITVKPNFIFDPGISDQHTGTALFVGRLSSEKGIGTLLKAWSVLSDIPIRIAGDGPMLPSVKHASSVSGSSIQYVGMLSHQNILTEMKKACWLVFPSEWYEGFPMTLIEAFACGLPVIASRLGSVSQLIKDGVNGLLFSPGNAEDLAVKIRWARENPREMAEMGINARHQYEEEYTAEKNYEMLIEIYNNVARI